MQSKHPINAALTGILFMLFLLSQDTLAQERPHYSIFPGYLLVNSDQPSAARGISGARWVFGASVARQKRINGRIFEFSLAYAHGHSTIYRRVYSNPPYVITTSTVSNRYRSIPFEVLLVRPLNRKTELKVGANMVLQDRTLFYRKIDISDDRLLSFGLGLSAKFSTNLYTFDSGSYFFTNLGLRWTEFIFHDKKNRNLDGYTFRHIVLSPAIGYIRAL
ncbi:MAG: hypothetical protein EA364_01060 [Balneolaceae bacterium]|nr:MAG: hypothetical protein EA364_01060 [Balneolaceae bacterium]